MSIEKRIRQKIAENLEPEYFELINESHKHKGHVGDDGSGETHFNLMVVSLRFDECNRIQRHRLVYAAVEELFSCGLHALSITALTPSEYKNK